jgi:hypothetical protein
VVVAPPIVRDPPDALIDEGVPDTVIPLFVVSPAHVIPPFAVIKPVDV